MREAKWFQVTPDFDLRVYAAKSGVYVQWSKAFDADDAAFSRWRSYSKAHCEGVDSVGCYYRSTSHATSVIRGFLAEEKVNHA